MKRKPIHEAHALFRGTDAAGSPCLFLTLAQGGWEITSSGKRIAFGTGAIASIEAGAEQFALLTRRVPKAPACSRAVRRRLNAIDAGKSGYPTKRREHVEKPSTIPEISVPFSLVRRRPLHRT